MTACMYYTCYVCLCVCLCVCVCVCVCMCVCTYIQEDVHGTLIAQSETSKFKTLSCHLGSPIRHIPRPREHRVYASRPPAHTHFFPPCVHTGHAAYWPGASRGVDSWLAQVHGDDSFFARVFQLGTIFSHFPCFCFFRDIHEFLNIHGEP
jgi:hypothetical protein